MRPGRCHKPCVAVDGPARSSATATRTLSSRQDTPQRSLSGSRARSQPWPFRRPHCPLDLPGVWLPAGRTHLFETLALPRPAAENLSGLGRWSRSWPLVQERGLGGRALDTPSARVLPCGCRKPIPLQSGWCEPRGPRMLPCTCAQPCWEQPGLEPPCPGLVPWAGQTAASSWLWQGPPVLPSRAASKGPCTSTSSPQSWRLLAPGWGVPAAVIAITVATTVPTTDRRPPDKGLREPQGGDGRALDGGRTSPRPDLFMVQHLCV